MLPITTDELNDLLIIKFDELLLQVADEETPFTPRVQDTPLKEISVGNASITLGLELKGCPFLKEKV